MLNLQAESYILPKFKTRIVNNTQLTKMACIYANC